MAYGCCMGWTVKPPGAKAALHNRAIGAIDAFESSYRDALANPQDRFKRSAVDHFVLAASKALEAVDATPGHAALDQWGLANVAFLHENSKYSVHVEDVVRPVEATLMSARRAHEERAVAEHRKRRNPLRWLGFGMLKFVGLLTRPVRMLFKWATSEGDEPVPAPLVLVLGLVSFVAVAGVTVTLLV